MVPELLQYGISFPETTIGVMREDKSSSIQV